MGDYSTTIHGPNLNQVINDTLCNENKGPNALFGVSPFCTCGRMSVYIKQLRTKAFYKAVQRPSSHEFTFSIVRGIRSLKEGHLTRSVQSDDSFEAIYMWGKLEAKRGPFNKFCARSREITR